MVNVIVYSALVLLFLGNGKCNVQEAVTENDTCEKDSEGNCLQEEGASKYIQSEYGPNLNPKQYMVLTQRNAYKVMWFFSLRFIMPNLAQIFQT